MSSAVAAKTGESTSKAQVEMMISTIRFKLSEIVTTKYHAMRLKRILRCIAARPLGVEAFAQ